MTRANAPCPALSRLYSALYGQLTPDIKLRPGLIGNREGRFSQSAMLNKAAKKVVEFPGMFAKGEMASLVEDMHLRMWGAGSNKFK